MNLLKFHLIILKKGFGKLLKGMELNYFQAPNYNN